MKDQPKKVLICEDHQIVIDGLLSIFKNQTKYDVIGFVKNGSEVVKTVTSQKPHVILLDLNLPNKNGLEILKELKLQLPELKIVVLTMYNKESIVQKVMKFKANGFLLKNCSSDDLLNALDSVFESNAFYHGKGVKNDVEIDDGFIDKIKLTRREKEIISELILGKNVPQIAETLFISTYTVETHKKNIFKKLDIHNTIDLVTFVNESNLFS